MRAGTEGGVVVSEVRWTPTMAHVADLAGVSHQTVSRVLNDSPHVASATRRRVRAAMAELGYRPNPAARALVTRRTRTIGVVACDATLYGPASTLMALEEAARGQGYLLSAVSLRHLSYATVTDALEHLTRHAVDGLVVLTPQRAAAGAVAEGIHGVPVVTVEGDHDIALPLVCVDQRRGAQLATQHLLDLGHATVEHVAGPGDWLEAEARSAGWRDRLEAAGIEPPEPLRGDWSAASGYHAGQVLAARGPEVSAVFVGNDQMALGVLRALREAGRDVPGAVSVVGFDDVPEAGHFSPPLTTVRQDFAEVGRRAIELLVELLVSGPTEDATRIVVPPELVVRLSTGPPPSAEASSRPDRDAEVAQ